MDSNGSGRFEGPTQGVAAKVSTLLALAIALASSPVFSQGAMTPGGGAMAPQPRVAPAPQAPVVAPQAPVVMAPNPATPAGDPQKILRIINNSESDTGTNLKSPGTPTTGGPVVPQRIAGTPLQGTPVGLEGEPGGIAAGKGKTDAMGNVTFKGLKPGRYSIVCCDDMVPAAQFLSVSTSVNGTLQSRHEFPVGSSGGTFTVSSARDTITLTFATGNPSTSTNAIGGTGGGRYTFKPTNK